jgi:superfamily I DNA and/or RNA helicase
VLELLVRKFPQVNVVPLTLQRRMPKAIADFISTAFYGGQLHTDVDRAHRDELFAQPFAFVDTSTLPARTRAESKSGKRQEEWGRAGYVNHAEADLLVQLAAYYHRRNAEWAVIVPYRAQVDLISRRLGRVVGSSGTVELNVGTVDSFQGGERDVILYGFTRSNQNGNIGFLDELRRANVAFTRAKHLLVLVGDLSTLTCTTDHGFRELARSLRDHVTAHGDLRSYQDVMALLGETREVIAQ